MVTVLDSSALLRLCFAEGDLSLVERAMRGIPVVSVLAAVELPCAVAARRHRGQLLPGDEDRLRRAIEMVLRATAQVALSAAVRQEAAAVAGRHLMRALDAIHVGTALVVARQQRRRGREARFCTADLGQAEAARTVLGPDRVDTLAPLPLA